MTEPISLATIRAQRSPMTPSPWNAGEDPDDGEVWDNDKIVVHRIGRHPIAANTTGIAVTHNVCDVLIEIAEAALSLEQAKKRHAKVCFEGYRTMSPGPPRPDESIALGEIDDAAKRVAAARSRYVTALSRVRP